MQTFGEWLVNEGDFDKIAKKAGKFYGSEERGRKVAGAMMQKALKRVGKDTKGGRSALATAARHGYDIEVRDIDKAVKYGEKKKSTKKPFTNHLIILESGLTWERLQIILD